MSPAKRRPPTERDLPRIPVRLPDLPASTDFFRHPQTPRSWPRETDPPLRPDLAAPDTGPGTDEFSVAELNGVLDWPRQRSDHSGVIATVPDVPRRALISEQSSGPEPGRHRGTRRRDRPVVRAAVPLAAVLAAGGGAFALIQGTDGGTRSQALDVTTSPLDPGATQDLANAPSSVDGSTPTDAGWSRSTDGSRSAERPTLPTARASGPGHVLFSSQGAMLPAPGVSSSGAVTGRSASLSPGLPLPSSGQTSGPPLPSSPVPTTSQVTTPSASSSIPATPPTTPSGPPTPSASTPSPSGGPNSSGPSNPPTSTPSGAPSTPSSSPAPTHGPATSSSLPGGSIPGQVRVLRTGDSGPDVADLQARLDRLISPEWIAVTGVYDSRTARAVAYAQQLLKVAGDQPGVYGPATYAALVPLT